MSPSIEIPQYQANVKPSNAKIAGMEDDLNLSSPDYQWLLTIFYISYIIFEWFALMWKVVPPHAWAAFCVIGWGITATLQAATFSFSGMMAARFFLGFFEAGYGPGIPYLLSFFYLRHEIGVRIGLFLSAAPLATCFAGALAYGITSGNDEGRIANWRLLFLVEGIPCVLAGVATFFFLPDSTEKASFLTEEDKVITRARGVRQVGDEQGAHRVGHINFKDVGAALLDLKVLPSFFSVAFTNLLELLYGIDVFLLQCILQFSSGLPPNNPFRNGLQFNRFPRIISTTILSRIPSCHCYNLRCRSNPATRCNHHHHVSRRSTRLHSACNHQRYRSSIYRRFLGSSWYFSMYWEYLTMGSEQSRLRYEKRDRYRDFESRRTMWSSPRHESVPYNGQTVLPARDVGLCRIYAL